MNAGTPLLDQLARGDDLADLQMRLVADADRSTREALEATCDAAIRDRLQLVAVGGYGRGEAFPHADLDIVVLYDGPDGTNEDAAERLEAAAPGAGAALAAFFDRLRSRGARTSPRVRAVPEHLRLVVEDVTIGAAALDTRHLAGPLLVDEPRAAARAALATDFAGGVAGFCALIHEGVQARHARFGGTAHLLEPQLKMGRGGLRDGHAVWWTAGLRFGTNDLHELVDQGHVLEPDRAAFEAAYRFIARTRLCTHAASRWRNDRLAFALQDPVARAMGFGDGHGQADVQAFLTAFYEHAETLATTSLTWLDDWASPTDLPVRTADGLLTRGGRVVLPAEPIGGLDEVEPVLIRALDAELDLHPEALARLREVGSRLPARVGEEPAAQRLLHRAVLEPDGPGQLLRWLVDGGLLGAIVPEWVHLVGHASHDVYHVYTTDRHLLAAFETLRSLDSDQGTPAFVQQAWLRAAARGDAQAIRLATLMHDIGKGLDGDHSMIGAGMAREIGERAGLDDDACRLVRWLVLEHLRMARTSQRRDPGDATTVETFLTEVPDSRHLDALVVLTWCDMTSVGPAMRTGWKRDLLAQLDHACRVSLGERSPNPPRWVGVVHAQAGAPARAREVLDALPEHRWAELLGEEVEVVTALLVARLDGAEIAVTHALTAEPGRALVGVICPDRRGLLADLTAAVGSEGIAILRARVMTTPGGAAVDVFELDVLDGAGVPLPARRIERVCQSLDIAARGEQPRFVVRSETTLRLAERPPVATDVVHAETLNDEGLEVFEIKTRDRMGLLSVIADTFDHAGYDIVRSIVTVEGDRAIDTFFVRPAPDAAPTPDDARDRLTRRLADET